MSMVVDRANQLVISIAPSIQPHTQTYTQYYPDLQNIYTSDHLGNVPVFQNTGAARPGNKVLLIFTL